MGGLLAADALIEFVRTRADQTAPLWPNIVACIESITNAAKAVRRVASFVIQRFQQGSDVFTPDTLMEPESFLLSVALRGESSAHLPINELPLRIKVRVVA